MNRAVTTVDSERLLVAAHEMGHAVAWHTTGFQIVEIRVSGHVFPNGYVRIADREHTTPELARDYIIGLLAGREAEHQWCDLTGQSPSDSGSSADLDVYRKYRKYDAQHDRFTTHLTDRQLRVAARKVVTAHWPRIERLAPQLAERGAIKL
jgi:hypothetical protein